MNSEYQVQLKMLKRAIDSGRPPQAIIFSGQDHDGQKELAKKFFELLSKGQPLETDLMIVSPINKEIHIGQIRDLANNLSFRPQFAGFKAVIIEQAHTLNHLAQNCFLKTLEEPPGKTFFILITAFPETLLSTVRSRCCVLKFFPSLEKKPEQIDEIENLLKKDLAYKFDFLKKFFDKDTTIQETEVFLENFTRCLRCMLLEKLGIEQKEPPIEGLEEYSIEKLKRALVVACDLKFLATKTNINQRLGFENLMLNL